MIKILGLDISSNTIGWSVLKFDGYNIDYISSGFIKPLKNNSIIERLFDTKQKISELIKNISPDFIIIEDLVHFMPKSTANTVIILASFNRMICLLCYELCKKLPILYNPISIRHMIKKSAKLDFLPKKQQIPEIISNLLKIDFPWIYGKNKKIKIESYDIADAIACAYCYIADVFLKINKKSIRKKLIIK